MNLCNSIPKGTLVFMLCVALSITSCLKGNPENKKTLRALYKTYKSGVISECKYQGKTVYSAGLNAYDAGSSVYDADGQVMGTCHYAWGAVDSICHQLTNCEVIYRVKNNIWGQPAVDKYSLGF